MKLIYFQKMDIVNYIIDQVSIRTALQLTMDSKI